MKKSHLILMVITAISLTFYIISTVKDRGHTYFNGVEKISKVDKQGDGDYEIFIKKIEKEDITILLDSIDKKLNNSKDLKSDEILELAKDKCELKKMRNRFIRKEIIQVVFLILFSLFLFSSSRVYKNKISKTLFYVLGSISTLYLVFYLLLIFRII